MAVMNVFKTTTTAASPLDGSNSTADKPLVSDFITVQSFTNFAAMTGASTCRICLLSPGALSHS